MPIKSNRNRERQTKRSNVQGFSKASPTPQLPVDPPRVETPNLASLAHNPGKISDDKRIAAQQNAGPVEDIITAQVVGTNFRSGEIIVKDGSGNTYNVGVGTSALQTNLGTQGGSGPSILVGQSVIISRSRSQSGERTVRLLSVVKLGETPGDILASFGSQGNVNDLCKPSQNSTRIQSSRPAKPPEQPEEQEEPAPPQEENPNDPPGNDPPSKPFGCDPGDSAQWYNGSSCPAGTTSLGFAELPGGAIMSLCEGPGRPPGDGCPAAPDTYGWECQGFESCVQVPNGLYATKAQCEANCLPPEEETPEVPLSGFRCIDGSCVEDNENPQYETLEACNSARVPIFGETEFTGGQCPIPARYFVTGTWEERSSFRCSFQQDWRFDTWQHGGTSGIDGPIHGLVKRVLSPGSDPVWQISHGNGIFSNIFRTGAGGSTFFAAGGGPGGNCSSVGARTYARGAVITSIVRVGGAPDNCGDPPPPIEGYECP